MKGIHIQFEGINSFIDNALSKQESRQYDCYLLNLEKITLQTFAIINIVFNNAIQEIPLKVKQVFEETTRRFKKYFQFRPNMDSQADQLEPQEFDQIKHFLENRIDVGTNDKERGELFKYLNQSQEKQKNNMILLQNIPKYSYGKNKFQKKNIFQEINQPIKVEKHFQAKQIQTEGCVNGIQASQMNQKEVQTDHSLKALKELVEMYSMEMLVGKNEKQTKQAFGQVMTCLQSTTDKAMKECLAERNGRRKKSTKRTLKKKKTFNDMSSSDFRDIDRNNNSRFEKEDKNSVLQLSKEKDRKEKNTIDQLQVPQNNELGLSCRSIIPSKKQITRRSQAEELSQSHDKSKKNIRNSKKLNPSLSSFNNISGEKSSKHERLSKLSVNQSKNATTRSGFEYESKKKEKMKNIEKDKEYQQVEKTKDDDQVKKGKSLSRNSNFSKEFDKTEKGNPKKTSTKQQLNSKNIAQIRDQTNFRMSELLQYEDDQRDNWQANNCIFRQIDKNRSPQQKHKQHLTAQNKKKSNSKLLPSLDNKYKNEASRRNSGQNIAQIYLKKNNDINSKMKNNGNNLSHQSLHMRQSQNIGKLNHLSMYKNDHNHTFNKFTIFKQEEKYRKDGKGSQIYQNLTSNQKKQLLSRQNQRLLNQIKDVTSQKRNKNLQWVKLIRNIREYQALHTKICGEDCIHLKKFAQFLKKHNLGMYSNRKLLQVHKKNIQISPQIE